MSKQVALTATAKILPGREQAFVQWQTRYLHDSSGFPGFVGCDMIPPRAGSPDEGWTVIVNFDSEETMSAWRISPERMETLKEAAILLEGGAFTETISVDGADAARGGEVTEVIFSKVKPGMTARFREWSARIQSAQAAYPGYRGMSLQPPKSGQDGHWTSVLRYDSAEHLEDWMNAPERKVLLEETTEFMESEELMSIPTAFPGWVPVNPATGEGPPNWKAAMLVLLGLFPIVMLQMRFLNPPLAAMGVNSSLGVFIGNVISVAITSLLTMPLFVRWFDWWLFPKGRFVRRVTIRGIVILCLLFAGEVILLWRLLP